MVLKSEQYRQILAATFNSNDSHEEFTSLTQETLRSGALKNRITIMAMKSLENTMGIPLN